MQHKRQNHILDFSDSKPKSIKIFSFDVPCMAPVMASAALYWTDRFYFLTKQLIERLDIDYIDYIAIINIGSLKHFNYFPGKGCLSFLIIEIPVLALHETVSICILKFNFLSRYIWRCFWCSLY